MLEPRLKCYTHALRGLAFMFKKENFPCSVLMAAISADNSCWLMQIYLSTEQQQIHSWNTLKFCLTFGLHSWTIVAKSTTALDDQEIIKITGKRFHINAAYVLEASIMFIMMFIKLSKMASIFNISSYMLLPDQWHLNFAMHGCTP